MEKGTFVQELLSTFRTNVPLFITSPSSSRAVRAESLGGRSVRQRVPYGFCDGEAEAPFRPEGGGYQAEAGEVAPAEVSPHPGGKPASGFLRAPPLPPGPGKGWPPPGGENSIRFERVTVFTSLRLCRRL